MSTFASLIKKNEHGKKNDFVHFASATRAIYSRTK